MNCKCTEKLRVLSPSHLLGNDYGLKTLYEK